MAPFWIEPAWSVESFLPLKHPRTGVISWVARPNPKAKRKFLYPHKRILRPHQDRRRHNKGLALCVMQES